MESVMCHSVYWTEAVRKQQEARKRQAREKRAATIEGLLLADAGRQAPKREEAPHKEHVLAK
jgi:hypothetical protein